MKIEVKMKYIVALDEGTTSTRAVIYNLDKRKIEKVKNGATAYFSYNGGQFEKFEEFFGLRSKGIVKSCAKHTAKFDDFKDDILGSEFNKILASYKESLEFTLNDYGKSINILEIE